VSDALSQVGEPTDAALLSALAALADRRSLGRSEARDALRAIMAGACTPAQIGAVKNLNPIITPQPGTPSTFRAVRVPASTRCADVIAMRDTLFPR